MSTETEYSQIKGVGEPARRALARAGYSKIEELAQVTEKELSKLHGMGPKALRVLREALIGQGLDFKKE